MEVLGFSILVTTLNGDSKRISGLQSEDSLQDLRRRVAETFALPRGVVQLAQATSVFEPKTFQRTLQDMDISEGSHIVLLKQRLFEVFVGMKIEVYGAGTDRVNGTYTAMKRQSQAPGQVSVSPIYFQKDFDQEAISWYSESEGDGWPSAWYMQTQNDLYGIYYLPSSDWSVLPLDCWESCDKENAWSIPGKPPMPSIDLMPCT